ncbi:hypothetical protein PFISCL1PPCAC_11892, partial [Pristionchus fissidentatus]
SDICETDFEEAPLRPVCIRGPLNHVIAAAIIKKQPDMFQCGVPTTSRPPIFNEIPGHDYHFTSEGAMLDDIRNRKFIEYCTNDNYLYGMSIDSGKECLNQGRQCVLNTTFAKSVRILKSLANIQPIVIYVATSKEQIRNWAPRGPRGPYTLPEYFVNGAFHNGEVDRHD